MGGRTSGFGMPEGALLWPHARGGASVVRPEIPSFSYSSVRAALRRVCHPVVPPDGVVVRGGVQCIARVLRWLPVLPTAHTSPERSVVAAASEPLRLGTIFQREPSQWANSTLRRWRRLSPIAHASLADPLVTASR